jgi:hypothetical protein
MLTINKVVKIPGTSTLSLACLLKTEHIHVSNRNADAEISHTESAKRCKCR